MNDWGTHREVEKPKKERQLQRHARLRTTGEATIARLARREDAIIATLGVDNPLVSELRQTRSLVEALVRELREEKSSSKAEGREA